MKRITAALATLMMTSSAAQAGTITGTITLSGGGALSGMTVRAFEVTNKGLVLRASTTSSATGAYSLTVTGNANYKVDAGGPPNYAERWYDVAAPASAGYVPDSADALFVSAAGTVTGIDIALQVGGGLDGRLLYGGSPLGGAIVRLERNLDYRIHHNTLSEATTVLGRFSFRRLPPANDYQIIVYDPSGIRETLLLTGTYTISSNTNGSIGDISMVAAASDPYEGNNSPNCSSTLVDESALHADPPFPWQTNNARIAPRGSDPDWYCFQAVDGDRLLLSVTTQFNFSGDTRYHPWTDPIMSWWRGPGTTKLAEDDDSGGGYWDSFIDTGALTAGCYCAAISTFGDPDYNGSGQGSSGRYTVRFEMGNRPPVLKVRKGTVEVPYAPETLVIAEGQQLDLDIEYPDADHDSVTTAFSHTDSLGADVVTGTLNLGASGGSYSWMAGPTAAANSPYTITVQAGDAEFNESRTVTLVVTAVNDPPETPGLLSPINGEVSASPTPQLTISNAFDPDGDALTYEFEVYYGDTKGAPAQVGSQGENLGGQTAWLTTAIPENTRVFWRARANDGLGGISAWSAFGEFLVDTANDAPEAPVLIKPAHGELIMVRRPGLSVINVLDPEDDAIEMVFEVATDVGFGNIVWTSSPVAMSAVGGTTMTAIDQDLAWGGTYFARAYAVDARGGSSDYSNTNEFRIKPNVPPSNPAFVDGCTAQTLTTATSFNVRVSNVEDVEAETVSFEVQIFHYEDDPNTVTPIKTTSTPMQVAASATDVTIDPGGLDNGHYRYRIRAHDGSDYSASAVECEFTLEVPEEMGMPGGGCCQSSGPGASTLLGLVLFGLALRRRRPRHGQIID